MPTPLDTLKTLQDLEITGTGDTGSQQQQHYGQQTIEGHGQQQPAQTLHHLHHPTAAPHPAALHAHPSEQQPHSTTPAFCPPLLDQQFAFYADSTIPIDPGLRDARFDHPAAPGQACGGVSGFHHDGGRHQHWAAAPPPVSSVNMDNDLMVSPTTFGLHTNSPAQLQPGMSSFEPMINTTWSMDGSLPPTSRCPCMFSSVSVPSNSTPASSRSPVSPRNVGAGLNNQPPSAGKELSSPGNYPGVQLEPWAGDQPGRKRRRTVEPKTTARTGTETSRSHRNNSSPGFSTPPVPIAPAPVTVTANGDDNNKSINNRKGSNSNSNSAKHAEKTKTKTTTPAPTTITTPPQNADGPSEPSQPGPSTTTTTAPGQPPDPRARNREAANRCRAKSKVAVAELEATERALGSEHEHLTLTARHLRDEVLSLKTELLMHGNCDDELIQQYLTNSARMVGSGAASSTLGGGAVMVQPPTGTTTTTTTMVPPGTSLAGHTLSGGDGGAMHSASLPRVLPAGVPPLPSAPRPGARAGRGKAVGRQQQ